jgi:hypothetical protein
MPPFRHILPAMLLSLACLGLVACAATVPPASSATSASAASTASSAASAASLPPVPLLNVPVTLEIGKSATLRPGLSLSFDGVNDSRCPQNVKCVWAGQLLYHLALHTKVDEPFTLSDKAPAFTSPTGITIHLANEQAPALPVAGQPAPPYAVMLLINSN